ncbi:MAG: hypothetical protein GYB66_11650, partial [Chloroflexi bacterium]|nr:hypothetical protein [Chloroflexota bacterium]
TTLAYFHYTSHRRRPGDPPTQILPIRLLRVVGQGFIAVTLGALYAQAILTSLAIFNRLLDEHMRFLLDQVGG